MNKFTFSYPTKVYFGEGSAEQAFDAELGKVGETVMLAYGGGSIKKNGIYDEMKAMLSKAGKKVVDFFRASCRTQPIRKYRKAQRWRENIMWTLFWRLAAAV